MKKLSFEKEPVNVHPRSDSTELAEAVPIAKRYVVGCSIQKNRLNEKVLLSNQNTCLN